MDTMHDKDFVAEAQKIDLEINPVSGADVESLVKEVYATPPEIVAKAKAAAGRSRPQSIKHSMRTSIARFQITPDPTAARA